MEKTDVLAKTSAGLEEIKSRSHGLSQKLRTLLIMADGQKSVEAVFARFGAQGDVMASLEELLARGFVEIVAVAEAAVVPSVLEEGYFVARSGLCRLLYDLMGPEADSFTVRIETADTPAEFQAACEKALAALQMSKGAGKAAQFRERAIFIANRYLPG